MPKRAVDDDFSFSGRKKKKPRFQSPGKSFHPFLCSFFLQDSHIERRRTKRLHDEVLKEGVKRRRIFHEDVDDEETTSSDFVSTAASTSSEGWF